MVPPNTELFFSVVYSHVENAKFDHWNRKSTIILKCFQICSIAWYSFSKMRFTLRIQKP